MNPLPGCAGEGRVGVAAALGRPWLLLALLIAGLAIPVRAAERIPPAPTGYVTDEAGLLSADAIREVNSTLESFERESSSQIVVAIYPRMESESSIEDYTVRVAQSWHVGRKGRDNGAVLFAFVQDHRAFIQVGYGLEPRLTDALCRRIIDNELKPAFRTGHYDTGVRDTVNGMIAATRGEYQGNGSVVSEGTRLWPGWKILFCAVFVLFWLRPFFRSVSYRGNRTGYSIWPSIIASGSGRSSGGGGFSGGGGGGFSGGGGSFGGGGAGGSW